MGYKDIAKQARESKTARELMPAFFRFEKEGDEVIGKYISSSIVTSRQGGGEYLDYVFDTDDGAVHFAPAQQFDKKVGPMLKVGGVYAITFNGKRDIGKGRRVNDFSVQIILEPEDAQTVGSQSELPI